MAESGWSSGLLRRCADSVERRGRGRPQPENRGSPSFLQGSEFRPETVFWCPCDESARLEDSKRAIGIVGSPTQWNRTEIRDPSCPTQIFGAQGKNLIYNSRMIYNFGNMQVMLNILNLTWICIEIQKNNKLCYFKAGYCFQNGNFCNVLLIYSFCIHDFFFVFSAALLPSSPWPNRSWRTGRWSTGRRRKSSKSWTNTELLFRKTKYSKNSKKLTSSLFKSATNTEEMEISVRIIHLLGVVQWMTSFMDSVHKGRHAKLSVQKGKEWDCKILEPF